MPSCKRLVFSIFKRGTHVMRPMASDRQFLTVRDVGTYCECTRPQFTRWSDRARFRASESVPTGDSERTRLRAGWLKSPCTHVRQEKSLSQARMEKFDIGHWPAPAGPKRYRFRVKSATSYFSLRRGSSVAIHRYLPSQISASVSTSF